MKTVVKLIVVHLQIDHIFIGINLSLLSLVRNQSHDSGITHRAKCDTLGQSAANK